MFPKMGRTFPSEDGRRVGRLEYQMAIAAALKRELGGSHTVIKVLMRWTGVSERTAKNWIAGTHGPAGEHLIWLMCHSQEVLAAVLALSGREAYGIVIELVTLRSALARMASTVDEVLELQ